MDTKVLGPDVNESRSAFTVTPRNEIRFGLNAVKGVGENAVEEILAERDKNGPFKSIFDLTARVNLRAVNKKNLESMARAGAFDFDERYHRAQYFSIEEDKNGIDLAIRHGQKVQADKISGQTSMFGHQSSDGNSNSESEPSLPQVERMTLLDELRAEEEMVGVFLSKHPLDTYRFEYEMISSHPLKDLAELQNLKENHAFQVMGIITSVNERLSQKGEPFGRFTMLDYSGSFEFAMFGKEYLEYKSMLTKDYILVIKGKFEYNQRNDRTYCRFQQLSLASDIKSDTLVKSLQVDLSMTDIEQGADLILTNILNQYPGKCVVWVNLIDSVEKMDVKMVTRNGLEFGQEVLQMLDELNIKYTPRLDDKWKVLLN
ncbi:MAG: hypothetical protein IPK62_15890 [Bacteroidetes bacterium]|nr:hypothetical protein [Bacteroidota bacterium]